MAERAFPGTQLAQHRGCLRGIDRSGEPVINHEDIQRPYEAPDQKYNQSQQHNNNDGATLHFLLVPFVPDQNLSQNSIF